MNSTITGDGTGGSDAPAHRLGPRQDNYVVRHWRGELSLGVSYWVNGFILGNLVPTVAGTIANSYRPSLRVAALIGLATFLSAVLVALWSSVGIWRSANRHPARGGRPWIAGLAKFMVVMGVLAFVGNWTREHTGVQLLSTAKIALGISEFDAVKVQVSTDGRSLRLAGPLGLGSAEAVEKALASAKGAKALTLDSPGGLIHEATQIAELVRSRRLSTHVASHCASACTLIFLAGADRAAALNAQIGFHRSSVEGIDEGALGTSMTDAYRRARISSEFIRRANETPAATMWYPTHQELVANGVITRTSLAAEDLRGLNLTDEQLAQAFNRLPMWQAGEMRFPGLTADTIAKIRARSKAGASDAQAMQVARDTLYDHLPQLLATTTDELRERFRVLILAQLRAAMAVSPQACGLLLDSKLDVVGTLPPDLVRQEAELMTDMLQTAPPFIAKLSDKALEQAMAPVFTHVSEKDVALMSSKSVTSQERCPAVISYFSAFGKLPEAKRRRALRANYQAEES